MGKYSAPVTDHLVLPAVVSLLRGSEHVLRMRGKPIPAPISVRLLIDTGSKRSTLIPGIIRQLDPEPGNDVRLVTPLAAGRTSLCWLRLEFPGTHLAPYEHVQIARVAMPAELAQFHGVLGRDLLRQLDLFAYEGRRGRYTLRDTPGLFGWLRRRFQAVAFLLGKILCAIYFERRGDQAV